MSSSGRCSACGACADAPACGTRPRDGRAPCVCPRVHGACLWKEVEQLGRDRQHQHRLDNLVSSLQVQGVVQGRRTCKHALVWGLEDGRAYLPAVNETAFTECSTRTRGGRAARSLARRCCPGSSATLAETSLCTSAQALEPLGAKQVGARSCPSGVWWDTEVAVAEDDVVVCAQCRGARRRERGRETTRGGKCLVREISELGKRHHRLGVCEVIHPKLQIHTTTFALQSKLLATLVLLLLRVQYT